MGKRTFELVLVLWAIFCMLTTLVAVVAVLFVCVSVCLYYRFLHREGLPFHNWDLKCHSRQDIDISAFFFQNASKFVAQWMKLSTRFVMFFRSL